MAGDTSIATTSNAADENSTEEKFEEGTQVMHELEHYRQRWSWDCGVACVMMLLSPEQRQHFQDNFEQICEEEGFGTSTWTIDLCFLLKRFGIKHKMFTLLIGVNEEYQNLNYYCSIYEMDKERVERKFEEAVAAGLVVRQGILSSAELQAHLASRGPAVALVDAGLLVCDLCKHNKIKAEFRRCFGGSYRGHYVVCVGFSRSGRLLYRDPALRPRVCAASPAAFHRARLAPGTDHDIILIYKTYFQDKSPDS